MMTRTSIKVLLAGFAFVVVASAWAIVPARADTESFTLYGSQAGGWGFTSGSVTNPGPTLTVKQGETVNLTLHSLDPGSVIHDWFIDYNNNRAADTGEPKSIDFNGSTPQTFSFLADRVGTFTYRCNFHPTTMTGTIIVLSPPTFELYGNGVRGWGLENTTASISKPGPTLVVNESQSVTIDITSTDGQPHSWFIDLNNDKVQQASEPHSNDTSSSTRYTFTVTLSPGNYTYRCQYHPTVMFGTLTVRSTGGGAPAGLNTSLIVGGIVIVVVAVVVIAAVMARRKKT